MTRVNGFTIQNGGQSEVIVVDPFSASTTVGAGVTSLEFTSSGDYHIRGLPDGGSIAVNLFTITLDAASGSLKITPQATAAAASRFFANVLLV